MSQHRNLCKIFRRVSYLEDEIERSEDKRQKMRVYILNLEKQIKILNKEMKILQESNARMQDEWKLAKDVLMLQTQNKLNT